MKNDRSVAGIISGGAASLLQQIYSVVSDKLGFGSQDFGDFAGTMVMYRQFTGVASEVVRWVGHISVGMLLGILFAQLFRYTSSKYWWLKGGLYGMILWFLLTGIGTLFKMPSWTVIKPDTAINLLIGSVVYGLLTSLFLKLLDRRTDLI